MTENDFLNIARKNQKNAFEVIEKLGIYHAWDSVAATVHLIGSLKTGLLMKHLDIDFHIYTEKLNPEISFKAVGKIASCKGVEKIDFINLSEEQDACLEWHLLYKDENHNRWQIDMIHIRKGSKYDGFFEKIAEQINTCMTPEQKETVLRLKFETPDHEKITGIEYYRAVMQDNVQTYHELKEWREKNPMNGIWEWQPKKTNINRRKRPDDRFARPD